MCLLPYIFSRMRFSDAWSCWKSYKCHHRGTDVNPLHFPGISHKKKSFSAASEHTETHFSCKNWFNFLFGSRANICICLYVDWVRISNQAYLLFLESKFLFPLKNKGMIICSPTKTFSSILMNIIKKLSLFV